MDKESLLREIKRLNFLLALKSDEDDEETLAFLLIGFLMSYQENKNADYLKREFLNALEDAYRNIYDDDTLIDLELSYQSGFLSKFIQDLSNGKLSQSMIEWRARLYAQSLWKFRQQAFLYQEESGDDGILEWQFDNSIPMESHCPDCPKLNKVRKKASEWKRLGLYPGCSVNGCQGNCRCRFHKVA